MTSFTIYSTYFVVLDDFFPWKSLVKGEIFTRSEEKPEYMIS